MEPSAQQLRVAHAKLACFHGDAAAENEMPRMRWAWEEPSRPSPQPLTYPAFSCSYTPRSAVLSHPQWTHAQHSPVSYTPRSAVLSHPQWTHAQHSPVSYTPRSAVFSHPQWTHAQHSPASPNLRMPPTRHHSMAFDQHRLSARVQPSDSLARAGVCKCAYNQGTPRDL